MGGVAFIVWDLECDAHLCTRKDYPEMGPDRILASYGSL
jgi:hypothetical protein